MFAGEDHKERGDEVIHPLDVPAGGVADRPYEQYPFEDLEESRTGGEENGEHVGSFETHALLSLNRGHFSLLLMLKYNCK